MIQRARNYLNTILRREHWWAEFWSGFALFSFGLISLFPWPGHLYAVTATRSFMILLPNTYWQFTLIAVGLFQMFALLVDGPRWRWYRGTAAAVAALFMAWITESEILYAVGLQPAIIFTAGWIGVNCFAVSRIIGGLR